MAKPANSIHAVILKNEQKRINDNKKYKLSLQKTSNQITMQLSQTGTNKKPPQNRIPGITHILQLD
jgi:hypothetical protein